MPIMKLKNRYLKNARISEQKTREIVKYFALDLEATKIAKLTNLNRNTINRYLKKIRTCVAKNCEKSSPLNGEVEVDESYFGAKRVRGKRGRGAAGKTPVFGLLKRSGKVYTEIVPDCSKATLQAIIRGRVSPDSVIHSDGWRGYSGLVDLGYKKHFRVNHGRNEFVRGRSHINGIESFWGFAKVRLAKLKGVPKFTFYFHLKECEFRFNHRRQNIAKIVLRLLRIDTLS